MLSVINRSGLFLTFFNCSKNNCNIYFCLPYHYLLISQIVALILQFYVNFAGSLKEEIKPGSIIILDDFIDRTKSRVYTFYDGSEQSDVGVCHLPMYPAFDERTRKVVLDTAKEIGLEVFNKGTIVCIEGPRFSTRAESNLYRSWGADLVGMTICPESILAKEKGMLYTSIAMATDYDCWRMGETMEGAVCVEEVMATFKKNVEKVTKLVLSVVPNIQKLDWTDTINDLNNIVNGSIMLPNQYSK